MKTLSALFRHRLPRVAFAAALALAIVGCGQSRTPAKKETDPAKVEQKRQEHSKEFNRERQGK